MPVTKSAKKALKRSQKLRERNLLFKLNMKKKIREFKKIINSNNFSEAKEKLADVYSIIDRCAKRNIIHKNAAARKKSRLTILLNKISK